MSTDKSRSDSKRWKNGKNITIPFAQFQQPLPDPSVGAAAQGLIKRTPLLRKVLATRVLVYSQ